MSREYPNPLPEGYEVRESRDNRFYPVRVSYYVVRDGQPVLARGGYYRTWKTDSDAENWAQDDAKAGDRS